MSKSCNMRKATIKASAVARARGFDKRTRVNENVTESIRKTASKRQRPARL